MNDWWRGSVTYQIYPRSFQDDSGDGIGDLRGITRRLSHVADLGADAVWLSPVFTSPMADMGYDVADYTDIDPLFGTLADFDALVARAHDLGLKVIIDQVLSHSSAAHPFFEESRRDRTNPKADWYVWADPRPDGSPPTNWVSVFGGPAWEWEPRRRQYYLHNFLVSQPDFNFHSRDVREWLLSTMEFWLKRGVDGFRLDTANFYTHDIELRSNPPQARNEVLPAVNPYEMQSHVYDKNRPENVAFLEEMRALMDRYDARALVGEVGESGARAVEIMAEYTRGRDRLHMAYSFEMLSPVYTAAQFRAAIEAFYRAAPDGMPCWSFSNHDVVRHVSRWAGNGEDDALAKQAAAMLLAFEGSVCLYQGEELGQTETDILFEELTDPPGKTFWPDYKGRDGCRTPMVWDGTAQGGFTAGTPWLPVKPPQLARNVAAQAGVAGSVLEFYRAMLAFRRAAPVLRTGRTRFLDLPEPMLAFQRGQGPGALLCLYNLGAQAVALTVRGTAALQGPSQAADFTPGRLSLDANGVAFLPVTGAVAVAQAATAAGADAGRLSKP